MSSVFAAHQSDWSAFLNPDAETLNPRKAGFPRLQSGALTRTLTGGRFSLIGNGHVSIAAVPGLVIHVRKGTLWITQAHDSGDHVVRAGGRFVADRSGRLVISAFERGEVELQWPSRQRESALASNEPLPAAA